MSNAFVGPVEGTALGGCFHVTPPSVERQIPERFLVCRSNVTVAITMLGLLGLWSTLPITEGTRPSTWAQVLPASSVRHRPPRSEATRATRSFAGSTLPATTRPE